MLASLSSGLESLDICLIILSQELFLASSSFRTLINGRSYNGRDTARAKQSGDYQQAKYPHFNPPGSY